MSRTNRCKLTMMLIVIGVLAAACGKPGEPISRTPNDKCLVRACSVYY